MEQYKRKREERKKKIIGKTVFLFHSRWSGIQIIYTHRVGLLCSCVIGVRVQNLGSMIGLLEKKSKPLVYNSQSQYHPFLFSFKFLPGHWRSDAFHWDPWTSYG